MDDYQQLGYDKFLNKPKQQTEVASDEFDIYVDKITGSKITEGAAQSTNGRLEIDFDDGGILIKEGDVVRAELKKFVDNKIGLRVYNKDGTVSIDNTI